MHHRKRVNPPYVRTAATEYPDRHVQSKLAYIAAMLTCALFALMVLQQPTFAQSDVQTIPANSHSLSFGDGWECDLGYRIDDDACSPVIVPRNAYENNRSYGTGWDCGHGYRQTADLRCDEVIVPTGGYLDPSGKRWKCLRGFVRIGDACREIIVPEHAYLPSRPSRSEWLCDRGYVAAGDACIAIVVPDNAYLKPTQFGRPWASDRGYFEKDGRCDAVVIPANAYFDDASYGKGWRCDRGFSETAEGCDAIDLPENAHLDRSGNRWDCHRGFQKTNGQCVFNN